MIGALFSTAPLSLPVRHSSSALAGDRFFPRTKSSRVMFYLLYLTVFDTNAGNNLYACLCTCLRLYVCVSGSRYMFRSFCVS